MSYSIKVGANAENDLLEVFLWYEEIREGLGIRFEDDFRDAVSNLVKSPYSLQVRYEHTRIIYLKTFSYGIHYRIRGNHIQILAVIHTSRRPRFRD